MAHVPIYSDYERGERQALLEMRSFLIHQSARLQGKALAKEIDAYCQQRLHDIQMDAAPPSSSAAVGQKNRPQAAKR